MTDKERLEDIRAEVEQMAYTSPLNFEKTRINKESVLWLMEKLEELELEINAWRNAWQEEVQKRKRYKQALEFYADKENYFLKQRMTSSFYTPIELDKGEKARQALDELSDDYEVT